ncbi:MAG TPA: DUF3800 domain-containing protein [Candidatus Paceibacterota bacterium]|nr:DUF3800 domain-containing protein [Candidatus Paceibacterota bacterium]
MSTTTTQPKTLYLFIDESGNFDFSPKGTKYFLLTGLLTFDPLIKREKLIDLRYRLLRDGKDQEFFHASEDTQAVRDQVFDILASIGETFEVRSILARKNKTNPALYRESYTKKGRTIERSTGMGLYRKLAETLLQYIFKGKEGTADNIVVVLGSLYVGDKKRVILQTLKHFLKTKFPGIPFEIYSHQTCADLNCQLADYCCWAIAVRAERGEERPYEVIKNQIKSVFDIFKNGDQEYYKYDE